MPCIIYISIDYPKQASYRERELKKCRNSHAYEKYKETKEVKKLIWDAKCKVHNELYRKLDTKDGENRIAILRDKKSKDLNGVRGIKSVNDKILVKEEGIKER